MFWGENNSSMCSSLKARERCILSFKYAIKFYLPLECQGLNSYASFQSWSPAHGFEVSTGGPQLLNSLAMWIWELDRRSKRSIRPETWASFWHLRWSLLSLALNQVMSIGELRLNSWQQFVWQEVTPESLAWSPSSKLTKLHLILWLIKYWVTSWCCSWRGVACVAVFHACVWRRRHWRLNNSYCSHWAAANAS